MGVILPVAPGSNLWARSGQKEGANCAVAAVPVSECHGRIRSNLSAVLCDGWIEMALLE